MTDWDRIVRDHGPTVFAAAWRILGHSADTEDVVQEVFLQAHVMARTEAVRCWEALLRRLASCRALDKLRQRRRPLPLDEAGLIDGPGADPGEIVAERELSERLRWALGQLPPREASVFCLRYFDDLPYDEIATSLGISGGAVATALHKARAKLEDLLLPTTQEK
ncbi:MAG: sigma-70 family RNA polymerase sigma factor [Gemmataceae bacterium]|nr:sigma-70 family RNA polymerase sigma factor [Gemmataceae bacterium]